jgi:hypothetical protein
MKSHLWLCIGLWAGLFLLLAQAQAQEGKKESSPRQITLPPITEAKRLVLKNQKDGENGFPRGIILKSEKEAREILSSDSVEYLVGKVDYDRQLLVVFAWAGSGMDKVTYEVAESFPEQVKFELVRGRTRDYVHHVQPFIVRKNVRWRMDIPWNWVKAEIQSGRVESVFQTHKKNVTLQMKGGYQLETVEPALDDIIKIVRESGKDIPIATE